jgi:hypothetical protein
MGVYERHHAVIESQSSFDSHPNRSEQTSWAFMKESSSKCVQLRLRYLHKKRCSVFSTSAVVYMQDQCDGQTSINQHSFRRPANSLRT